MKTNYLKKVMLTHFVCLFTGALFAQGPYVFLYPGMNFKMSSQNIDGLKNSTYVSTTTSTGTTMSNKEEQVIASLGKGFSISAGIGYMYSRHLGAELGLSYLAGSSNKAEQSTTNQNQSNTFYNNKEISLCGKMFRIIPTLVLAGGCKVINPYAKFGLVVGFGSILEITESNSNATGTYMTYTETLKRTGGVALGFNAAFGATYKLSKKFLLFGDLNMFNLSYAPTKGRLIEATRDGEDILGEMTTSEKEIKYVKSLTDTGTIPDDSEPSEELRNKYPFGSFGINVGVTFNFGNCEKEEVR